MTTLAFLLAIATIMAVVIAIEGGQDRLRPPAGLITWLVSGNWPAKIGAALVIVGTGALLRYAALNVDIPSGLKLGVGVAIAAALGFASIMTRSAPAQRTLSLTLGGAASGVSYLTAYTAFVLHGYLDNATGLGLLALTAIATGVFAVTRGALSLALLAMVGAYLAPVFAVGDPGPYVVYGYYVAASALTLAMVAARGWRPLIHLSFLFTLVGGVFFAWSAHYYAPAHFDAMAPMLLMLAALHVAMPIVERRDVAGTWLERLDLVYLLALPVVVTVLAIAIAPSRGSLSVELIGLGVIWLLAAIYLRIAGREGTAAHGLIGTLLIGFGVVARFRGLPWDVVALACAVAAFAAAVYSSKSQRLHSAVAGVVLLLGAVHAITSLGAHGDNVFLNPRFIERMIAAALLVYAGVLARKVRQPLDSLLLYLGSGWAILTVGSEIIRWNLVSVALLLHWLLILAALAVFVLGARLKQIPTWAIVIPIGIAATVPAAATAASFGVAIVSVVLAITALMAFAMRPHDDDANPIDRVVTVIIVPIVTILWVERAGELANIRSGYLPLAMATLSAMLALRVGSAAPQRSRGWLATVTLIFGFAFAIALGYATIFDIERSAYAIGAEFIGLGALVMLAVDRDVSSKTIPWIRPVAIFAMALFLQATLLRWLGPDGDLNVLALSRMQWPALTSLLWACMGAALTVWSRKGASRTLWVGGAGLLVATVVKLLLIDLESLGELTNILAVIAAGGAFLLVGWLAPMPPAADPVVSENESDPDAVRHIAWSIALIVAGALLLSRHGAHVVTLLDWTDQGHSVPIAQRAPTANVEQPTSSITPPAEDREEVSASVPIPAAPPARTEKLFVGDTEIEVETLPAESACTRFAAQLPSDYEIYAAGALEGRQLDFLVGRSRDLAAMFDVQVNVPGRNVVLVLGSSKSALWAVQSSAATKIVGVWLAGQGKHEVIGVSSDVPVLRSYDSAPSCSRFYVSGNNPTEVKGAVVAALSRAPHAQVLANDGELLIGEPRAVAESRPALPRNDAVPASVATDPTAPPPGDRGLQQLVRQGKLRPATVADYTRWVAKDKSLGSSSAPSGTYMRRTYLITGPMTFPAGLHGAHMATFILLPGVPFPQGDPGHSQVIQGG